MRCPNELIAGAVRSTRGKTDAKGQQIRWDSEEKKLAQESQRKRQEIISSSIHGPRWLTGGTIGPEGSVMGFLMIAIAFAAFNSM